MTRDTAENTWNFNLFEDFYIRLIQNYVLFFINKKNFF